MNNGKERVKLSKVIQKMNLVNLTPQIDVSGIWLNLPDVNRPALRSVQNCVKMRTRRY